MPDASITTVRPRRSPFGRRAARGRSIAQAAALAALCAGCGSTHSAASTPAAHAKPAAAAVTVNRAPGAAGEAHGGPLLAAGRDWGTLLRGASHYGAAVSVGPQGAHVLWQRNLGSAIVPGPITRGGVAYVAGDDGVLHALAVSTGRELWSFNGGGKLGLEDLSTSATLLADGSIVWPGPHGRVYALSPDGRLRWTLSSPAEPLTPAVDEAARLLVIADADGNVSGYRLQRGEAQPARLWSHAIEHPSYGNPAIGADGTTYVTGGDSLYAFSPSGQLRWQVKTPQPVEVSAALAQDGTVVFGSDNKIEYGVRPDGSVRWQHPIGNFTYSSPVGVSGDLVVYGNHSGVVSVLDAADGQLVRSVAGTGQIWTSAAVDSRGDIYFATQDGDIYGFGPTGGKLFAIDVGGAFDSYPAIAADGTLLIGGSDGVLRAIG
jgi:outer membrane protein assembly factor BamB